MNHLLKFAGHDTAALFNRRLQDHLLGALEERETAGTSEYLEEDYE